MKKAILLIGVLFLMLNTIPSFAQETGNADKKGLETTVPWYNSNSKTTMTIASKKLKLNNVVFQVKSGQQGFDLYEDGSSNSYAQLVPTQKEGLYRYTSSTINGAAHFNSKGNLLIKYLDNETGETKEIQFQSN